MDHYRIELRDHLKRRAKALGTQFMLFGIFGGLLLSGVIDVVPTVALGIGCGVWAGGCLHRVDHRTVPRRQTGLA